MAFTQEQRSRIYDRTSGRCHLCHKKLAFKNYGAFGTRGAWEVEHSRPQANGGTHHLNNLFPACIHCNRAKGTFSAASARAKNGKRHAPLSKSRRAAAKAENAFLGGLVGVVLGAAAGPLTAFACAAAGAHFGHQIDPE